MSLSPETRTRIESLLQKQPCRAVHEGLAERAALRFLRGRVRHPQRTAAGLRDRRRARGSGNPRGHQGLRQLADDSAAVRAAANSSAAATSSSRCTAAANCTNCSARRSRIARRRRSRSPTRRPRRSARRWPVPMAARPAPDDRWPLAGAVPPRRSRTTRRSAATPTASRSTWTLATAQRARGIRIDWVETVQGSGLSIDNPNAPSAVRALTVQELKSAARCRRHHAGRRAACRRTRARGADAAVPHARRRRRRVAAAAEGHGAGVPVPHRRAQRACGRAVPRSRFRQCIQCRRRHRRVVARDRSGACRATDPLSRRVRR